MNATVDLDQADREHAVSGASQRAMNATVEKLNADG